MSKEKFKPFIGLSLFLATIILVVGTLFTGLHAFAMMSLSLCISWAVFWKFLLVPKQKPKSDVPPSILAISEMILKIGEDVPDNSKGQLSDEDWEKLNEENNKLYSVSIGTDIFTDLICHEKTFGKNYFNTESESPKWDRLLGIKIKSVDFVPAQKLFIWKEEELIHTIEIPNMIERMLE